MNASVTFSYAPSFLHRALQQYPLSSSAESVAAVQNWQTSFDRPMIDPLAPELTASSSGAYVMPCTAATSEVFTWNSSNSPGPGYVSSSWGGSTGCLTTCACETGCIQFWLCGQGGCGTPGQSYEWSMPQGMPGPLANAAYAPGGVLTYANGNLGIANYTGADGQVWAFNATSGQIVLPRLGLCLSTAPVQGDRTYAQVCARATGVWPWTAPMPAYCLQLDGNGTWVLAAGADSIAEGQVGVHSRVGQRFDPTLTHELVVSAFGTAISAYIDGIQVASVTDDRYSGGSAAIGGGWHPIAFDSFSISSDAAEACR